MIGVQSLLCVSNDMESARAGQHEQCIARMV